MLKEKRSGPIFIYQTTKKELKKKKLNHPTT